MATLLIRHRKMRMKSTHRKRLVLQWLAINEIPDMRLAVPREEYLWIEGSMAALFKEKVRSTGKEELQVVLSNRVWIFMMVVVMLLFRLVLNLCLVVLLVCTGRSVR